MVIKIIGTRLAPPNLGFWQALRAPRPSDPVKRREIPYWQERGWARGRDGHYGNYQTRYGAFRGMIEERGRHNFHFYIFDPPELLKRHSHWVCFQPRGKDRYRIHMATMPDDISSGILVVERIITEAFQQ